ncbi:MAG: LacI family transcriptional regulator [Candidatus Sumerlaeia bacterium]|nr:LacI family transcriptional regulator [Candidatus Sumerlaeia bacterium]
MTEQTHITIKELARSLNIAPSTVSMALNDHPHISPETKRRVKALARKLNYRPNLIARAMVRKRTNLIGVIISDIRSSFFPEIIQGIEDVISQELYSAIICATEDNAERERHYLSLLREKRVDGIIAEPILTRKNLDLWNSLLRQKFPIVFILRQLMLPQIPFVIVDNYRGGYLATQHLIQLGHCRIGHLAGPSTFDESRKRRKGFITALKDAGLPLDKNLIRITDFNLEAGYQKTLELLRTQQLPTAIFACSDIVAIGALKAIREMKLRVPEDIALIGFDDLFFAAFAEVPLSSVAQPKYEIGVKSANKLLTIINGGEAESEILEPHIVIRQSSGVNVILQSI